MAGRDDVVRLQKPDVFYHMHSRVHMDCGAGLFSMASTAVAANCQMQEHFHSGVERSFRPVAIKG